MDLSKTLVLIGGSSRAQIGPKPERFDGASVPRACGSHGNHMRCYRNMLQLPGMKA